MPRRIEIELTSRTDGAFTWRAAGAKQPKGVVASELLPAGVAVGDVVRAEIETGLEGLEIVSVLPRQEKADDRPVNRIEVIGTPKRGPDVLVSYASGRPRRDDGERGERGGGRRPPAAGRGPRARRAPGDAPDEVRPSRGHRERADDGGSRAHPRAGERGPREDRGGRPDRVEGRRGEGREGAQRGFRGERRAGPPGPAGGPRSDRSERSDRPERADRREAPGLRRQRVPAISTAHRNAMLATLGPQELPVAEQLLRGGIPAVRQALAEQRAARPGDAAAEVNRDAVLAVAEQLLPRVNLATWKDRAASAQAAGKEFRLRELRAVVTSARTVSLDEEARTMARTLQESLDQRVRALRDEWLGRITKALDEGRVTDAVRVASRAPEPATRLPAELAVRIAEAAGEAMTAETSPAEWIALLEAVVETPVRRNVKPRGIPEDAHAKEAARRAAGLVPELAKLLGLRIPPPPPRRPTSGLAPRRAGGRGAGIRSGAGAGAGVGAAVGRGADAGAASPDAGAASPDAGGGTALPEPEVVGNAPPAVPDASSVSAAGDAAPADVR